MATKFLGFSAFGLRNLGFDSGSVIRQKGYSIVPVKGRLGDSYTYIGVSKNQKSVLLGFLIRTIVVWGPYRGPQCTETRITHLKSRVNLRYWDGGGDMGL